MSNMSREEFINWMVQNIGEWPTFTSWTDKAIVLPAGYEWYNASGSSKLEVIVYADDLGSINEANWRAHIIKVSSRPEDSHIMSRSEFFDWMAQNIASWPDGTSSEVVSEINLPEGHHWNVTCGAYLIMRCDMDGKAIGAIIDEGDWLHHRGEIVSRYNKTMEKKIKQVRADLIGIINKHSLENESDTPDFIIADFLIEALSGYNKSVNQRSKWYRKPAENKS